MLQTPPSLGIFWWVPGNLGGHSLVVDTVPLAEAEPYGDCLTHPRGHHEVWEQWRRLGHAKLRARGIPVVVIGQEYETFPRGRIVFHEPEKTFWIYADRRLQQRGIIAEIERAFGLVSSKCVVKSDAHYR